MRICLLQKSTAQAFDFLAQLRHLLDMQLLVRCQTLLQQQQLIGYTPLARMRYTRSLSLVYLFK